MKVNAIKTLKLHFKKAINMDTNIQTILLGLLVNGITSFCAQFANKDSQLILGEELFKEKNLEKNALEPILKKAAKAVAEHIEWQGPPSIEIICLFLNSPEAEAIIRQLYAEKLSVEGNKGSIASIRKEFLSSFYLFTISYGDYAEISEDQLVNVAKILFDNLIEGCEQVLNVAINAGILSAHEAKSAFRQRIILDELAVLEENIAFLTAHHKPNVRDILTFEQQYRRQVGNRFKHIIPPDFGKVRRLQINKLYVTPNIVSALDQISARRIITDPEEENLTNANTYPKVFSGTFRAVLLGNPGAGKSTFTHKLCFDLVTNYSKRFFGRRRELTPILVILRDYGSEKKSHNYSILEFIKAKAKEDFQLQSPLGAFEYLLRSGRAMVIFDGLDELLETRDRQEISNAVESFCTLYPSVPVLVTSREVGYEQAPLDDERFHLYRLAPFNEDQVYDYVKKWFEITTDLSSEQRNQKVDAFFDDSHMIPDLRSNPLMLALLCNIYREENYIPRNRPDVYEKCANMLFERWDRSRGIQVNLPYEVHLRPTMMYLAYWIYSSEGLRGGVTEEKLIAKTTEYLSQKLFEDEANEVASKFIEFCNGRAWVFTNIGSTKQGEELYQFTHQTFLEYFAASYLCRMYSTPAKLMNILRSKIIKREWDVVAQLSFQLQNKNIEGAGDKLLSTLTKQTYILKDKERWNVLSFIVRALEFMIPNPNVIHEIILACIKHSLTFYINRVLTKAEPAAEVFSYLLNGAHDNRKSIALHLENLLLSYGDSNSDAEALLALELAAYLMPILTYTEIRSPKTRSNQTIKRTDEEYKLWQGISDRILHNYSQRLTILCQKNLQLCNDAFRKTKTVHITDIIKWHGLGGILTAYSPIIMPNSNWGSISVSLLNYYLRHLFDADIPPNTVLFKSLQEVGAFLLAHPDSWRISPDKKYTNGANTYVLYNFIENKKQVKDTQKLLNSDRDALFSCIVLVMLHIEIIKVCSIKRQWRYAHGETDDLIHAIKNSNHPFCNYFRWAFTARYEPMKLAFDGETTLLDKVHYELNRFHFNVEQQNFIYHWVQREVNLFQNSIEYTSDDKIW